jgi:hypothetical protein
VNFPERRGSTAGNNIKFDVFPNFPQFLSARSQTIFELITMPGVNKKNWHFPTADTSKSPNPITMQATCCGFFLQGVTPQRRRRAAKPLKLALRNNKQEG